VEGTTGHFVVGRRRQVTPKQSIALSTGVIETRIPRPDLAPGDGIDASQ
jgi:hypothetical protein